MEDVPAIASMSADFWANTVYDEPCDIESVSNMAAHCIDNQMMAVLEIDGELQGFACGVVGPLLGNHNVLTGTEIAWWVNPDHRTGRNGIGLMRHLESLAKAQGVKYWNMIYMNSSMPETVKGIYDKMGYQPVENTYTRVL